MFKLRAYCFKGSLMHRDLSTYKTVLKNLSDSERAALGIEEKQQLERSQRVLGSNKLQTDAIDMPPELAQVEALKTDSNDTKDEIEEQEEYQQIFGKPF